MAATATPIVVRVYVEQTQEWREFHAESRYQPKCGHGLHQVLSGAKRCACEKFAVAVAPKEDEA